jgi:hypothetical protein
LTVSREIEERKSPPFKKRGFQKGKKVVHEALKSAVHLDPATP